MSDKISRQIPAATTGQSQAVLLKSGGKLSGLKMVFASKLFTAGEKLQGLADRLRAQMQTQKAGARQAGKTIQDLGMNARNNANVKNMADAVLYHIRNHKPVDKKALDDLMLMGRLNLRLQASDGTRPAAGRHEASMDQHAKAALTTLLGTVGAPPHIADTVMDYIRFPQQAIANATQTGRSENGADPLSTFRSAIGCLVAAANSPDKNDLLKKPLLDLAFQMQARLKSPLASELKNTLEGLVYANQSGVSNN